MREGGLEPPPGEGLDPKSSASTNSAILAVLRRPRKYVGYRGLRQEGACNPEIQDDNGLGSSPRNGRSIGIPDHEVSFRLKYDVP